MRDCHDGVFSIWRSTSYLPGLPAIQHAVGTNQSCAYDESLIASMPYFTRPRKVSPSLECSYCTDAHDLASASHIAPLKFMPCPKVSNAYKMTTIRRQRENFCHQLALCFLNDRPTRAASYCQILSYVRLPLYKLHHPKATAYTASSIQTAGVLFNDP